MKIAILRDAVMVLSFLAGVVGSAVVLRPWIERHEESAIGLLPYLLGGALSFLVLFSLERIIALPSGRQLELRLARHIPHALRHKMRRRAGRKRLIPKFFFYYCQPQLSVFIAVAWGLYLPAISWLGYWVNKGELMSGFGLVMLAVLLPVCLGAGLVMTALVRKGMLSASAPRARRRQQRAEPVVAESFGWTGRGA